MDLEGLISHDPPIVTQACAVELNSNVNSSATWRRFKALFNVHINNPPRQIDHTLKEFHQTLSNSSIYTSSYRYCIGGSNRSLQKAIEYCGKIGITIGKLENLRPTDESTNRSTSLRTLTVTILATSFGLKER